MKVEKGIESNLKTRVRLAGRPSGRTVAYAHTLPNPEFVNNTIIQETVTELLQDCALMKQRKIFFHLPTGGAYDASNACDFEWPAATTPSRNLWPWPPLYR